MQTFVLVLILSGATQPSFVSPYPDRASCETARSSALDGGKRVLRAAFCLPVGGEQKH